jgi:hypothetical protein
MEESTNWEIMSKGIEALKHESYLASQKVCSSTSDESDEDEIEVTDGP